MSSHRWRRWFAAAVVSGTALGVGSAHADEALFAYAYTSDVLPKGKYEVEQWTTLREGQSQGSYHRFEFRTELEYGITDNLQVSGYLNYSHTSANANGVNGETSGPHVPGTIDPTRPYSAWKWDGVSAELIWRALSPYKDPIGLAFYVEPAIGPDERELEFRTILHKTFLDDRLHLAANGVVELEREVEHGRDPVTLAIENEVEKATILEFNLGATYRFRPNWSAGVEYRARSEFDGYTFGGAQRKYTAHFIGPSVHYGGQNWFFTLTALLQVQADGQSVEEAENVVGNRLYGDKHTRWDGIRLKVGRVFR